MRLLNRYFPIDTVCYCNYISRREFSPPEERSVLANNNMQYVTFRCNTHLYIVVKNKNAPFARIKIV